MSVTSDMTNAEASGDVTIYRLIILAQVEPGSPILPIPTTHKPNSLALISGKDIIYLVNILEVPQKA